jgi:hypothetical protein
VECEIDHEPMFLCKMHELPEQEDFNIDRVQIYKYIISLMLYSFFWYKYVLVQSVTMQ